MSQSAGCFQAFPEPGESDLNEAFCTGRGLGSSSNPEGWILGSPYCFLCGLRLRLCVTPSPLRRCLWLGGEVTQRRGKDAKTPARRRGERNPGREYRKAGDLAKRLTWLLLQ